MNVVIIWNIFLLIFGEVAEEKAKTVDKLNFCSQTDCIRNICYKIKIFRLRIKNIFCIEKITNFSKETLLAKLVKFFEYWAHIMVKLFSFIQLKLIFRIICQISLIHWAVLVENLEILVAFTLKLVTKPFKLSINLNHLPMEKPMSKFIKDSM